MESYNEILLEGLKGCGKSFITAVLFLILHRVTKKPYTLVRCHSKAMKL